MSIPHRYAQASAVILRGLVRGIVLSSCVAAGAAGGAEPAAPATGWSLWNAAGAEAADGAWGQGTLRPPASWAWHNAPPRLELAAGIGHRFASGLNIDVGLSSAQVAQVSELPAIDYRDYFLGVSYGTLDGKLWYLPETLDGETTAMYYEAGWSPVVSDKLAFSLRLGQQVGGSTPMAGFDSGLPNVSVGASTRFHGYGLGLSVIDGGGSVFGGDADLRLMGRISRPLR
ncbi:MAG: hypothetical protein WCY26_01325 [Thiohalobacteraceae bacterium]|nr:hypothetical protein [Gammaproteobacteria bacterium]